MAYKLGRQKDVKTKIAVRLQRAARSWTEWTEPMRQVRMKMLKQYASGWYDSGFEQSYINNINEAQPLNLIDRYVNIIAPYLISHNPKVLIDPKRGLNASRSFARTFELAVEHLLHEINFSMQTMRPAVVNSLFSMGICKTGIFSDHQIEVSGYLHDMGQPYCDNIEFEDYIGDWRARRREEMSIEGNWYLMPEEYVKTSGLYKNTDGLTSGTGRGTRVPGSDDTSPDEISKKNRSRSGDAMSDIRRQVWLMDLWLPDEGVTVTIPPESQGDKILREVEYDGPENGPYDTLAYKYFPETIIPIPPVYGIVGLNNIVNRLVTKMKNQADREKKVLLYETSASDDADLIRKTPDGDCIGVRNPDSMKEVEFGGVSATNMGFIQYIEDQYSIQGGNLYTLGGRSSQADTLGQEQMLMASAGKHLQDMILQVHHFTRTLVKKLSWYLWSDPLIQVPVVKELGGFKLKVSYTPEVKEGDFFDYGFDIEPYSMTMMSPDMRYQRLMQLIGQVVLPTAQIAAGQGSQLNVSELIKEAARFLDVRNIDNWYISGMPQQTAMNPYQPMQGDQVSGQSDGRFGNSESDNLNNSIQHMNRTAGVEQSKPAAGSTTQE